MRIYDIYSDSELKQIGTHHKQNISGRDSMYILGSSIAQRALDIAKARKMIKDIPLTEDQRKTLEHVLTPHGLIFDDESSKMLRKVDKAVGT